MADIVAADVSAKILFRERLHTLGTGGQPLILVGVEITVDPGTTDTYPTGGIPLTNLFTTGNASDTWLDVLQPILEVGQGFCRIDTGVTISAKANFYSSAATAAGQVLVLQRSAALPSITGTTIAVASATSITDSGNGLVTAGFKVGDYVVADGFTGTAGNNGLVCRATVVAAGALTVAASGLTADAAGETVTLQTIYRPENAMAEHGNTDVTLGGDIAAGDEEIVYRTVLMGRLRDGVTPTGSLI